ncbi:MAG: oligosaccharide flippase family protein [Acidobacteriota bacterium]
MGELAGRPAAFRLPRESEQSALVPAAKGTSVLLAGKLFTYFVRLAMGILLGRLLGADQFGLYTLSLTAATVAGSLGHLGLDVTLVRYISMYRSRGDQARLWGTLQIGAIGALAATVAGLVLFSASNYLAVEVFHDKRLAHLFRIASIVVPFLAINDLLCGATQGFKNFHYTVLAQQFAQPAFRMLLLVFIAVTIGLDPDLATLAFLIATIGTSLILFYFLNKQFSLRRPWSEGRRETREVLGFSFPIYVAGLIKDFGSNIQALLIGSLHAARSVGIYTAAANFNMIGQVFHTSISVASMPILCELHDRRQWGELSRYYQTTTKWTLALNLPMFLVVLLFPTPVLALIGKGFEQGAGVLIILAWVNLLRTGTGLGGGIIDMTGHTRLKLANTIGMIAISAGMNILLVPGMGMYGAAWAALVAAFTINTARLVEVYVLLRLQPYNVEILKPLGAGLVASLAAWAAYVATGPLGMYPAFAAGCVVLAITYLALVTLFGLAPEDQIVLAAFRRRFNRTLGKDYERHQS